MKLRQRYIYGILILIGVDILFLIDIFLHDISSVYIFVVVLLSIFLGNILDKKLGYILDNNKEIFIILGVLVFSITVIIMTYMIVNK